MPFRAGLVVLLLAFASLEGCSTDAAAPPPSLSSCLMGWWVSPSSLCSTATGMKEATASDCKSAAFTNYGADSTVTAGVYSYSASLGTVSGVFGRSSYVVAQDAVQVQPGTHLAQAKCTSSQLTLDGQTLTRAPASIAAALQAGTTRGGTSFTSVPSQ